MPVYAYRGVADSGNTRGMVDADSIRSARAKLRADGIFPTQITQGRKQSSLADLLGRFRLPQLSRVPDLELVLFSNQLSTLLAAGVPVVESLAALTEQVENARLKAITGELREKVNAGTSLTDALAGHPSTFGELYCSMVRAGESSGSLPLVLTRLGEYIEKSMNLRSQITNALTYPLFMLVASGLVLSFLIVTVIPQITTLLAGMDRELPFLTRAVMATSDILRAWGLLGLAVTAAGLLALNRAIQFERGRLLWDRMLLRLPVIGRSVRYVAISRFARTLSTLVAGGVDIVRALETARSVAGNAVIARAVDDAREAITRGSSISGTLRASGEFPPLLTHMVSVGEASGELSAMLVKVADTFDELVDNALNRLTSLMGPLLLLIVAGVVVIVLLSTLLPLMDLTASL